jgi:chromosome segregation ATPase
MRPNKDVWNDAKRLEAEQYRYARQQVKVDELLKSLREQRKEHRIGLQQTEARIKIAEQEWADLETLGMEMARRLAELETVQGAV